MYSKLHYIHSSGLSSSIILISPYFSKSRAASMHNGLQYATSNEQFLTVLLCSDIAKRPLSYDTTTTSYCVCSEWDEWSPKLLLEIYHKVRDKTFREVKQSISEFFDIIWSSCFVRLYVFCSWKFDMDTSNKFVMRELAVHQTIHHDLRVNSFMLKFRKQFCS